MNRMKDFNLETSRLIKSILRPGQNEICRRLNNYGHNCIDLTFKATGKIYISCGVFQCRYGIEQEPRKMRAGSATISGLEGIDPDTPSKTQTNLPPTIYADVAFEDPYLVMEMGCKPRRVDKADCIVHARYIH